MTPLRALLDRFFRETTPSERVVRRVRRRLEREPEDRELSRAVLLHLPGVRPGAEARVRARLATARAARPARLWVGVGLACVTGAAAVGLVSVLPDPGSAPVQAVLAAEAHAGRLAPSPEVTLSYEGHGAVAGTRSAPRIAWESGTVRVEVEPDRGVALVVATREAEVQVLGTVFTVTRDALGTRVAVERGRVWVACADGAPGDSGEVTAGGAAECLPNTAAGLLTRAHSLHDQGAASADVLGTVDLALDRYAAAGALRGELQLLRLEALGALGRDDDALAQARAYLDEGNPVRRTDVLQVGARLAWGLGGCEAALPFLGELAEVAPSVQVLVRLADCQAPVEPDAARATLRRAQALSPDEPWTAAIEQRLRRL